MTRRAPGWPVALVLAVSACGSTAQPPAPEAGAVLPSPPAAVSAPAHPAEAAVAATQPPVPERRTADALGLPALPNPGRRPPSRASLPSVRSEGVDARRLRVGIATSATLRSGASHLPVLEAVEAFLNASGGVAGRRLELAVTTVPSDVHDQYEVRQAPHQQAACAALTQDTSVLAVLNLTKFARYGIGCYIDAGVPSYALGMGGLTEAELRRSAQWLLPGAQPHLERLARELPPLLAQQDALGTRIGVLAVDIPQHRDLAERVLVPGLVRAGGNVVSRAYVRSETGAADTSAAVLRFKAEQVDRVVLWLGGEGPWAFFARAAEDQGYRPQYAFTTLNLPGSARSSVPPAHLERAVGIGWDPYVDGVPVRPVGRGAACIAAVAARTGSQYVIENRLAVALVCEQLLLLQDALRPAVGRVLRRADVAALYRGLGDWQPLAVPVARFRPHKLDGGAVQGVLRYDTASARFRYTTPWRRWPDER